LLQPKQPFVIAAFHCREAAEALQARNRPAQGKHAESGRRPGYNGDYVRIPRPLWPQSAQLTGAKGAMELTCLPGADVGGMPGIRYQWLTDFCRADFFCLFLFDKLLRRVIVSLV